MLQTKVSIFLLIISQLFSIQLPGQQNSRRQPIREITLTGWGYELGLQHGRLLKKEIAEITGKWKTNTARVLRKDPGLVVDEFFRYAHFDEAIKKWTPDLYEEIRGIAEGAQQPFKDIMILNLLDEFWVYQDALYNHHCSAVGIPAVNGNPACIAQNIDIEGYTDGYQVLLRLEGKDSVPEQLIVTHPGLIALAGMNKKGVGACMNALMQLKASATGLPVAFIVRGILSSTNKNDLLKFIQSVPHASGQNYMIGIGDEVYDFEASANKVTRFDPANKNGTVYHTNHPLVNDDVKEWFSTFDPGIKDAVDAARSNSHIRLAAVQRRVAATVTVDDVLLKNTLRSKDDVYNPVCRSATGGGFTFASVIMTLGDKPFMQVTAGPPDESEYTRVDFSGS
ncbi:MAG: C45 family autoproteolytic acyltransferase/hydrolase [Ferruginibacter sp.]